jgi:hypothetical protein
VASTLPPDQQRKLLQLKIRPGSIIKIFCNFINDPKYKYCVIVHTDFEDEILLFFLVNSKIPNFIKNNPDLSRCQTTLVQKDYPFFSNEESYLNCADLFDDLSVDEVLEHLLKVPNDFMGNLHEKDIQSIIGIVRAAKTIRSDDKELIIASLGI